MIERFKPSYMISVSDKEILLLSDKVDLLMETWTDVGNQRYPPEQSFFHGGLNELLFDKVLSIEGIPHEWNPCFVVLPKDSLGKKLPDFVLNDGTTIGLCHNLSHYGIRQVEDVQLAASYSWLDKLKRRVPGFRLYDFKLTGERLLHSSND
jgi:hypothetical protein